MAEEINKTYTSNSLYNDSTGVIAFAEQLKQELINWANYQHVTEELGQNRPDLQNELNNLFLSVYERFLTFLNDADASEEAINTWKEIENFLADYTDEKTLASIVAELNNKIESRLTVPLESTTGNSTTSTMTQKAITETIDASKTFTTGEKVDNVGIDAEPTAGSENLVKSGGVQNELALGAVYDVSAKNPTAGLNNDGKWESLSALLSDANINTIIPTAVRKGGMSIKFVQNSDNKYVQYFLTKDEWSLSEADWQKMNLEEEVSQLDQKVIMTVNDNVLLDILDVNASTLSDVPYGVVDFGVDPDAKLPSGTTQMYLVYSFLRDYNDYFYFKIVNQDGTALIDRVLSLTGITGYHSVDIGSNHLVIDCNWLRSRKIALNVMDFGLTAPINFDKLKNTRYSKLLKEKANIKSAASYNVSISASDVSLKQVVNSEVVLNTGLLGIVCFEHKNTVSSNVNLRYAGTNAPLYYGNKAVTDNNTWEDGESCLLYYDGTNFYLTSLSIPSVNNGYFVNEVVRVENTSQRTKTYDLAPGSKIALRVSLESGTGEIFTCSWVKTSGNVIIESNCPMGYIIEGLVLPDDATGITFFMNQYAIGNKNRIEIFDATQVDFVSQKMKYYGGVDYVTNRRTLSITKNLGVSSSAQVLLSVIESKNYKVSGNLYAKITCSAILNDGTNGYILFIGSNGSRIKITALDLRDRNVFRLFKNETISQILVNDNAIDTAGAISIEVFEIDECSIINTHPLYGKKIMCFGDSVTEFGQEGRRYSDFIQDMSYAIVYNAGNGGSRYSPRATLSLTPSSRDEVIAAFDIFNLIDAWCDNDFDYQDAALAAAPTYAPEFVTRYTNSLTVLKETPITDIDIVTLLAGLNDYRGGVALGTKSLTNYDVTTEIGAINSIAKRLFETKPSLKVYGFNGTIMMYNKTVSIATSSDVMVYPTAQDNLLWPEYIKGIEYAFDMNHIANKSMYWALGFNVYNFTEYYGNDYSHPYRGFYLMADFMYKFLCSN